MVMLPLCTLCLVVAAAVEEDARTHLDAATDLLVDFAEPQKPPMLLISARLKPTLSFVAPGDPATNRTMTAYQIVVQDSAGTTAWDSGKVSSVGGFATGVVCENALHPGLSYQWKVWYWVSASLCSEAATSGFDIGLLSESDWAGARWLGGGQNQFKLAVPTSALAPLRREPRAKMKLYVAAPGGTVVEVSGKTVGDPVGLSLWTENEKTVQYFSYDLTAILRKNITATPTDIVVSVGGGFFSSTVRPAKATNGARPRMCRFLMLLDKGQSFADQEERVVTISSSGATITGRSGPVISDDPWMGTTINTSLTAAEGWSTAKLADQEDIPSGQLVPLPMPYATKRDSLKAVSAVNLSNRPGSMLYTFPANIVGHASISTSTVTGTGWIRLEHCETWNHSAGGCIPFGSPPYDYPLPICGVKHNGTADDGSSRGGCDTYWVDQGSQTAEARVLGPKFTWHGFQYVVVTPGPGVKFGGELDALSAHWTTSDLSKTAEIKFAGEGGHILQSIDRIVVNSQISNLAAFMPTDCPTREKHGWLADSQVTAEEAMYNFWVPSIYSRYLSQIRDSQLTAGPNKGFTASRVPGRASTNTPAFGQSSNGLDVSWNAAYPLDAEFLLRYYGDLASVAEHWPSLMLYMDGQLRVANGPTYANSTSPGLPDNWYWGDWCAIEPRTAATPGTGPQAAAANFLMALRSMVEIGIAIGDTTNAERYNYTLGSLIPVFHRRFWNRSLGTWASDPRELQTLTVLSLAAGVGSPVDRASAVAALDHDVQNRGYHLTVGSAGVKWLLRILSKEGRHDTALKLAMQSTYPSWGWWISQNATTCWESWSGVADPSHVSHPTHNHIFLCGGAGGWLYEYMAGIIPTSSGYATVDIKPHISKSLGPASVNAVVRTVRGSITSNWTRHTTSVPEQKGQLLVSLSVQIPSAVQYAIVRVPLLGLAAQHAHLKLTTRNAKVVATVWTGGAALPMVGTGVMSCHVVASAGGDDVLELVVGTGAFHFTLASI